MSLSPFPFFIENKLIRTFVVFVNKRLPMIDCIDVIGPQYLVLTVPSLVFNFDFVNGGRRTLEGLIHNCYQFNVWHGRPAYVESFSITSLHTKSIFINLRSNGKFIGPFRKCKKFCISALYVVTVVATSYYTRAVYDIPISVSKWLLYCYIYVLSVINT